jgi:hypothetical protein
MDGDGTRRGGGPTVRGDLVVTEVVVAAGDPASIEVEVTNVSDVIRAYRVDVLGLDPRWARSEVIDLELFPDERRSTVLTVDVPPGFPAGRRRIGVEITEVDTPGGAAIVLDVDLLVEPRESISFGVEPGSLTVGSEGTFVVTPVNDGNTTVELRLTAADPERKAKVTFDPPVPRLLPGERGIVRATVRGPRPWFGMPLVRVLEFRASTGTPGAPEVFTAAAFIQTPRLSRRLVSLAGLVIVATLFAFVIYLSFGSVADLAAANEALLKQSLGEDQPIGLRIDPSSVTGTVRSTTGGGLDGVSVELFEIGNPLVPLKSTVTDTRGDFRFGSLKAGTYFVRYRVAGFGETWFRSGTTIADATALELVAGQDLIDVDVALSGQPGRVVGRVVGEDVEGALVVARLPASSIEGSELAPVAARLAQAVVDATGVFVLEDLPTPAAYEIVASKPGYAVVVRTVSLQPGEVRRDFELILRLGGGLIAGTVVDLSGGPIPGALVSVADGRSEASTRTLSSADSVGTFEVRDLQTPGTYALTVSADGFFTATQNILLGPDQRLVDRTIRLTPSAGSVRGRVTDSSGAPLGGIDVTVVGPGQRRTTQTVSTPIGWTGSTPPEAAGTWRIDGLAVPGAYTVTFVAPGQLTQAVSVELTAGAGGVRSGVDAVLNPSVGTVQGRVREAGPGVTCPSLADLDPAAPGDCPLLSGADGVIVMLRSTTLTRTVRVADLPVARRGVFRFDDVPPGAYTVTVTRPGSTPQTLLVNSAAVGALSPSPLDVRLDPPATIGGRIGFFPGFVGSRRFDVEAYTPDAVGGEPLVRTSTDADGEFTLRGLPAPGSYVLEVQDRETGARRLFFGAEPLQLEPGVPIIDVDVFFRSVPHGDAAQLTFPTPPVGGSLGVTLAAFSVAIRDADGVLVTDGPGSTATVTIALGANPSFGILAGTASRAAVGGIASFDDLRISQLGDGYTLRASSGILDQVESAPFSVLPNVPGAPTGLTASGGSALDGRATLSWVAPTDDGGAPVTSYQIERRIGAGAWSPATPSSVATTTATVSGLTVGTTFEFRVRAVNSAGASASSTGATATSALSSNDVRLVRDGTASGGFVERGYAFRLSTTVTIDALYGGWTSGTFRIRIRDGGTGAQPFSRSTGLTVLAFGDATGGADHTVGVSDTVLQAGRWYWITQERIAGSGSHHRTNADDITTTIDRGLIQDWRDATGSTNAWTGDTTRPALGFRIK